MTPAALGVFFFVPKMTSSDSFVQFKPDMISAIEQLMEDRGKYSPISCKLMEVPCVVVYNLLKKAIKIVENTEEYTEYLLLSTFDDKNKYTKIPPGTIRVYQKNLVSFYNGRTWRKLK